jgi:glycosyltransferase involved in cell wall biosynthesis
MPAYLKPYAFDGIRSASNPQNKFIRAGISFIEQSFKDAELIIISDDCDIAEKLYEDNFLFYSRIRFKRIKKQPIFSGFVRQTGIEMAKGEIICYLDHDDFLGKDHLGIINEHFDITKYDWTFFNDYLIKGKEGENLLFREREVKPELFYIGTSMIAHKKNLNVVWPDGYTHDWRMIEKYLLPHLGIKIPTAQYYVCHFHEIDF